MRRHATLASISKQPEYSIGTPDDTARFLDDTAAFIRRAARSGADIVAFPEAYPQLRTDNQVAHAEPETGGTLDAVRRMACEHGLYLVWPRYERTAAGQLYNTSVLIDRAGEVAGRYHKMFPTIGEMEAGVLPGTSCPVFETDFGRVAMIICFDLNFVEVREGLRAQRPDVLIFSSMYRGGRQCHEWALDLGCYVLTAISAELGRIVDPIGHLLKLATYEALISHRVNLNKRQLHIDYNLDYDWKKMDAMLACYGPDLTFELATQEARFLLGYEQEDKDVDEIIRECGMEQITDYFPRARRFRQDVLIAQPNTL